MPRIMQNKILYSSGDEFIELIQTLKYRHSTLIFENDLITEDTTGEVFTSKYGVAPIDMTVTEGKVILTFKLQYVDIQVKVRLSF